MLPKSLHTVRVLQVMARHAVPQSDAPADRVLNAAALLGYGDATAFDSVIAAAIAGLDRAPRKVPA